MRLTGAKLGPKMSAAIVLVRALIERVSTTTRGKRNIVGSFAVEVSGETCGVVTITAACVVAASSSVGGRFLGAILPRLLFYDRNAQPKRDSRLSEWWTLHCLAVVLWFGKAGYVLQYRSRASCFYNDVELR